MRAPGKALLAATCLVVGAGGSAAAAATNTSATKKPKKPVHHRQKLGPVRAVAGLGQLDLGSHPSVAIGYPQAHAGRGAVQVIVGARAGRGGQPAGQTIVFVGQKPGDHLGAAVAGGGDVNGDGYPDFLMAAPDASPEHREHAGAVWLIFGNSNPFSVHLGLLQPDQGYEIIGAHAGDHLGASVAINRDMDGNGHNDMVIGAPGAQGGRGAVYAIYGALRSATVDLQRLGPTQGFVVTGAPPHAGLGSSVAPGGYQDNGPLAGLVAGAPGAFGGRGAAYVVYAPGPTVTSVRLGTPGLGYAVLGYQRGDHTGAAVAAVGNSHHTGYTDIAVGSPGAALPGRGHPGTVAIVYGAKRGGQLNLGNLAQGFTIAGPRDGSRLGAVLAGGDGDSAVTPEVILGAPGVRSGPAGGGALYVLVGRSIHPGIGLRGHLPAPSRRLFAPARRSTSTASSASAPTAAVLLGRPGFGVIYGVSGVAYLSP